MATPALAGAACAPASAMEGAGNLLGVGRDALLVVLGRLPARDVLRCRATCRALRALASEVLPPSPGATLFPLRAARTDSIDLLT